MSDHDPGLFARYPLELRVRCPLCGALPPQPCRSRRRGLLATAHAARHRLAAEVPSRRRGRGSR